MYWSSVSLIHSGYSLCWSLLALCLFIVAIACHLSETSVGVRSQFVVRYLLYSMGGSSIEYAHTSTVSPKRRRGVISFLVPRQLWLSLVGRCGLSFLLVEYDV